jgi:hypothetical protein
MIEAREARSMKEISVDRVWAAVRGQLEQRRPMKIAP